jgi:hypothetical protein
MDDRMRIICTDRGQHPRHQIALLFWQPELGSEGFAIWDATADVTVFPVIAIEETVRRSKRGENKVTSRQPVRMIPRKDEGSTFVFFCQVCAHREPRVRGETLSRIFRDTPIRELDVSLL